MKIHHAPNSRSVRALWLFNELDLPYELEIYPLGDKSMRTPEYLKVHPLVAFRHLRTATLPFLSRGQLFNTC